MISTIGSGCILISTLPMGSGSLTSGERGLEECLHVGIQHHIRWATVDGNHELMGAPIDGKGLDCRRQVGAIEVNPDLERQVEGRPGRLRLLL